MTIRASAPPTPQPLRRWAESLRSWVFLGGSDAPAWARALTLTLFALGVCLCEPFPDALTLHSGLDLFVWAALRWSARLTWSPRRLLRVPGFLALVAVAGLYWVSLYMTFFATSAMAWSTPTWLRVVAAACLGASLAAPLMRLRWRIPLPFALGVWIAICVQHGDWHKDQMVVCDDYRRITGAAKVLVPSRTDLPRCVPGQSLPLGRYPRLAWDSPDETRYLFSSQEPLYWHGPPSPVDTVTGMICETPPAGTSHPHCVGGWHGYAQGIHSITPHHEVLVGLLLGAATNGGTDERGALWALPEDGRLDILGRRQFEIPHLGVDFLYLATSDSILMGGDLFGIWRVRGSDLSLFPQRVLNGFTVGFDYDQGTNEGVVCGLLYDDRMGPAALAAFSDNPLVKRRLIPRWSDPWLAGGLAISCAISASDREAYAMIPNYGIVVRVGYDSGRVEKWAFVGTGFRNITYDARRRRVYLTDFLGRDVVALDALSLREVQRWPVGRFARDIRLTRDGQALLVGTTVGLVRIQLDPVPPSGNTQGPS